MILFFKCKENWGDKAFFIRDSDYFLDPGYFFLARARKKFRDDKNISSPSAKYFDYLSNMNYLDVSAKHETDLFMSSRNFARAQQA